MEHKQIRKLTDNISDAKCKLLSILKQEVENAGGSYIYETYLPDIPIDGRYAEGVQKYVVVKLFIKDNELMVKTNSLYDGIDFLAEDVCAEYVHILIDMINCDRKEIIKRSKTLQL